MLTDGAILEMRGICKFFPGVRALENVDFTLREGEIHALMGENGAGSREHVHRPYKKSLY